MMLYVEISGGLGNQLYKYATAYALAKENNCDLILDTTIIDTVDFREYDLDKFNIKSEGRISWGYKRKIFDRIFLNRIKKIVATKNAAVLTDRGYEGRYLESIHNHVRTHKNAYLHGGWQSYKYFENCREDLIEMFVPNFSLSKYSLNIKESIEGTTSIAVHIRRGDYVKLGYTLPDYYYKNAIKYMTSLYPNAVYYVFSDDQEYSKNVFENFSGIKYVMVETPDKNQTIADFYLMSLCKHHIIANSSYSWWAAYLNSNNNKTVLAPRGNDGIRDGLYPNDWIIIEISEGE